MLINPKLANLKVATQFGTITFNEKGENNDLKPEEQAFLGKLPGFEYKEDKKAAPKAPAKEAAKPEEVKTKEVKSEEVKAKAVKRTSKRSKKDTE